MNFSRTRSALNERQRRSITQPRVDRECGLPWVAVPPRNNSEGVESPKVHGWLWTPLKRQRLARFDLEQIVDVLAPRDDFHAPILLEPKLRRTADGVVIAGHGKAIRTRVAEREEIARH